MKPIAILHEGKKDKSGDQELLKMLIFDLGLEIGKIDFYGMGAKSNFFKSDCLGCKNLKPRVEADQIERILFVVDADYEKNDNTYSGYENTKIALEKIIADLEFQAIASICIMCDPSTKTGYLESLILSTIPDNHRVCIESFLECSNFKSKENHKAILNRIYKLAYPEAPYDFAHPHFDSLKAALKNLFAP